MEHKNVFIPTFLKYFLEGFVIAICAFYTPLFFKTNIKPLSFLEVTSIALTISLTLLVLDMFSQRTAAGARFGTGLGIGSKVM